MEKDVSKAKFRQTMKSWGKYINHVNVDQIDEDEKLQIEKLRSTSLTEFAHHTKSN